jgi:hypothetical protein
VPAAVPPNLEAVTSGLGDDVTATPEQIAEAYAEEVEAQAAACRIPDADPTPAYPVALAGALRRRVAVNLALRSLPLAAAGTLPDPANVTGVAADPEVRRLEGPHRKMIVG